MDTSDYPLSQFRENKQEPEMWTFGELLQLIDASQFVKQMVDIRIRRLPETLGARYDRESSQIIVSWAHNLTDAYLLTVREIRRRYLDTKGAIKDLRYLHPDHLILYNRILNADLTVAMVRAAYEMSLQKKPQFLNRLYEVFPRPVTTFEEQALNDFRTLNNGEAMAAAFESYFLENHVRYEDTKSIKYMLGLCPTGYGDLNGELSHSDISAVGSVPLGKNYLSTKVNVVLTDPLFTEIRERKDANFLWYIKFEKSFCEAQTSL